MPATVELHDSSPPIGPPHALLVVLEASPALHGVTFVLDRARMRFGRSRSSNEIVLEGEGISRRHGRFERRDEGQWWVVDNATTDGTYVNGEAIPPSEAWYDGQYRFEQRGSSIVKVGPFLTRYEPRGRPLYDGDRVRAGRVTLEFRFPSAPTT